MGDMLQIENTFYIGNGVHLSVLALGMGALSTSEQAVISLRIICGSGTMPQLFHSSCHSAVAPLQLVRACITHRGLLITISLAMGLYYYGLRDTTATYATNFLNLIPIVTFIFSTIAGIEKLGLNTKAGKIKIAGAILCVGGALTISLYKGKTFHILHHSLKHHSIAKQTKHNWARGSFFLVGSCLSYAIWFIVQVKLSKIFPSKYTATLLTCIIASVQSAIVGLCIDRRVEAWKLGWDLQLITIFYSGALATAATFCLISWAVTHKGPTYPPMFNPLTLIFVAFFEALILGEVLSVGSLLGMCLIIIGLYSFLWGRKNEPKSLHAPNIAAIEVATAVPEYAVSQSPATVMPTNCSPPDTIVIHIEENADKRSIEELQA